MNPIRAIYPALLAVERSLFRRDYLGELRFQRRMRKSDWKAQLDYSRRRAVAYANHMARVSPAYRQLLNERGVRLPIDERPESWQTLPILRKADFQKAPDAWVNETLDRSKLSWSCTSGSSGEPFHFPETAESRMAEFASFELSLREIGWRPGQPEGIIKYITAPLTGLRRTVRRALGTLPFAFSPLDYRPEAVPAIVEAFNRGGIRFLRSYPSVLYLIAVEMLRLGLRCHIPLIMVFAEGLSPSQEQVIEKAFNAKVYRDYGGSEAMHIGSQCARCPSYKLDLSRIHVEVLDGDRPASFGEPGEIVVTCFRNEAYPFVRYRMGDVAVMPDPRTSCPCGGGVWRLSEVRGRVHEEIYAPNGERLDSTYLVVVMEFLHEHILTYQFVQRAPDVVELLYVPRHSNARENLRDLEKQIVDRMRGGVRIVLTEVPEIPLEPSGKRKILVPLKSEWKASVE